MSDSFSIIEKWVDSYADEMYSWAYYKTSDRHIAEDVVQDTFFAAMKSVERFRGGSNPRTYLMSILNNKLADYYRNKYNRSNERYDSSPENEELLEQMMFAESGGGWNGNFVPAKWASEDENILDNEEFREIFDKCLQKLPERWFSVVQLKYIADKTTDTLCKELNISKTNYWQILHKTRLQLRRCLEVKWFSE